MLSLNLAGFRRQLLADTAKLLGWELLQPVKLRIRAARYKQNNATGLLELGRSGGNLQLLPLNLQNFWWESYFSIDRDRLRADAGVLKGGIGPYDSEVVDSAKSSTMGILRILWGSRYRFGNMT